MGEFTEGDFFRKLELGRLSKGTRPLEIDLGCGDGSFLVKMAQEYPERDFLGVERLLGRVTKTGKKIARQGLENAQVLRIDSHYFIEWLMPLESISRLHLLCPDPWPKARHHRRRMVQVEFLEALRKVLIPGGEFLFMTDHEEYYHWTVAQVKEYGKLDVLAWDEDTFFYPKTDFQVKWEAEGKPMWRLRCQKRSSEDAPSEAKKASSGPQILRDLAHLPRLG